MIFFPNEAKIRDSDIQSISPHIQFHWIMEVLNHSRGPSMPTLHQYLGFYISSEKKKLSKIKSKLQSILQLKKDLKEYLIKTKLKAKP